MAGKSLGKPLRRPLISSRADSQRIKADDDIIYKRDVGLRSVGLLVGPGIADEKLVEFFTSTIDILDRVIASEFLNAAGFGHFWSKNPGSRSNRSRRGKGRGGASRIAMNVFHFSALKLKNRRSASASPARVRALSKTKSLTER